MHHLTVKAHGRHLANALVRFLEADQGMKRDRLLAADIRRLQKQIAGIFKKQGKLFLAGFAEFKPAIDLAAGITEAAGDAFDWSALFDNVAGQTAVDFNSYLHKGILNALIMGGGQLFDELATDAGQLGISWNLENPRAVAYAEQTAASRVSQIDDGTRAHLNTLISQGTNNGWSYTKLSNAIGRQFAEFATGGENPRSRRVAVFELGDAYEAGNETAAREMEAAGLVMEKKWSTVGDDRVRPSHIDSQAEGWQLLDFVFASGFTRPPTDPGCRCTLLYRRATGKRAAGVQGQRQIARDQAARAEIDRQILAELEKEQNPIDRIKPPPGRAPRGMGTEYADRRAIASKIQSQQRYKSQAQYKLDRYRGQKAKRWEMEVATARVQELGKAISAAIDVADGPGDWGFKRELIDGIFKYVSAITG